MKDNNIIRIVLVTVAVLLIPLVAMQFTDEVDWTLSDFMVAGTLLLGTGLTYEMIARKIGNTTHRVVLGIVFTLVFFFVWAELAVGVFNIPGISGS